METKEINKPRNQEFIQEFINGSYYKASIIYLNGFFNVKCLKSYNTIIAFNINNIVIVNKEYYKCSSTTKRHYETFLFKEVPINEKIIYINAAHFYDLEKSFLNKNTQLFCELTYNIINKYNIQKDTINTLKSPLTVPEKLEELEYKELNNYSNETITLKTRTKHIFKYECNGVLFEIITTISNNKNKTLLSEKLKILNPGTVEDWTKFKDLKLYSAVEFLENSNKSEYIFNPAASENL